MHPSHSLKNHFLIAMPALTDPFFFRSVTYICEHNETGAMGIIINQPLNIHLKNIIGQTSVPFQNNPLYDQMVFSGGPIQRDKGFVLHPHSSNLHWQATTHIGGQISLTTSQDILLSLADNKGPEQLLFALGYAGWAGGQLEKEIAENSWLAGPANIDIVFKCPIPLRWDAAAALIGVDFNKLSFEVGHA